MLICHGLSIWFRSMICILYFPIPHNAPCLPPAPNVALAIDVKALGRSQEYFITIVYAKLGGQTECIMGNWKIENCFPVNTAFR